ncbi:mitochondrial import inner membrane translocase subunit Tim8 A-like [Vespa crabro]|uniref:mitochondrial import inner membrane translocase subunit Tim8 A-like n=1 Tax=Vespa crabro TaxID=7445 RepID=UPI001EFFF060|nr:mitochondrial import inner membrane translocase subunit Tim8 A-like [Vespa crabro]
MSLSVERSSENASDLQLEDFIEKESRRQLFQNLALNLTDICWETCIDRPAPRLEAKIEKCLMNCVERFIDTTNFITNRWERIALNKSSDIDLK